jgi:hypothetical protein
MKHSLTPRSPLKTAGKTPGIQTPSGALDTVAPAKEPDLVSKFVRENPKGTLQDPVEERGDFVPMPLGLEDAPAVEAVETPAAEAPVKDSTPETITAEPEAIAKPEETITAEAAPQAAAAAEPVVPAAEKPVVAESVAAEPKISYEPTEEIHLLPNEPAWTRQQVIDGLQERATLQPKADGLDYVLKALNQPDVASVERVWKPIIEAINADPMRGSVADIVLKADPGLLDYLNRSAQFYNELPADQKMAPAAQPQQTHDPRFDQYEQTISAMREQLVNQRIQSEWQHATSKFPFLAQDEAARVKLAGAADALRKADIEAGKDPLKARGLLDAMNDLGIWLEMVSVAHAQRATPAPARENPAPAIEPVPGRGAEALLGSNGPGPSGVRSSTPSTPYKGNDPVAAFLRDTGN